MTRNQLCWIAAAVIGALEVGVLLGWQAKPEVKPEPETWCAKRVYGFFLIGEKLELDTFTTDGTITCRYNRGKRDTDDARRAEVRKK